MSTPMDMEKAMAPIVMGMCCVCLYVRKCVFFFWHLCGGWGRRGRKEKRMVDLFALRKKLVVNFFMYVYMNFFMVIFVWFSKKASAVHTW
jgi:hypothetical protein